MRILFWTDGFWPRIGGIETQALQFIEMLQERGHHCTVFAQKDPDTKESEIYRGITIRRFDFESIFRRTAIKILRRIEDCLVQEVQPEIVHLNACAGWSAFAFSLFKRGLQVGVVLTVHAPFFYKSEIPELVLKSVALADQICCVSKWVFDTMAQLIPGVRDKLKLIYNGISMPTIAPTPLSFSPPMLLLLGRCTHEKGFDSALQAFALLKKSGSNAQLLIGGDGPERLIWEQLANVLGVQDSVQFIGALSRDEVPALINRATLLIVPSYFESFGLVALEAMQMERPVVASQVGGLQEIVSHEKTGLLVPPKDPIALCEAIQVLLRKPAQATEMGMRGRKWAMENFTIQQNVSQYEHVYKEVVGESAVLG